MKYHENTEQSAEYLRLALQHMTRQEAPLHPVSYAVWYEYVAGINPALKAEVDSLTQKGRRLSDASTYALYHKHIACLDEEASRRISSSVQQIVAEVSESAVQAGNRASQFGGALERLSDELAQPADTAALLTAMDNMRRDTREMREAIGALRAQLEQSTREAQWLKEEVMRAREEALVDTLTGLANRRGFELALMNCTNQAQQGVPGPCLLMVDIDHFKHINDTYGHLFGDKVLRGIGHALRANVKGKDTAARYGGEEFSVLLPETPLSGAAGLAETLRTIIAGGRVKRLDSDEKIGNITVSIGVTTYRVGELVTEFVGRADQALYASKAQGRNRVSLADGDKLDSAA